MLLFGFSNRVIKYFLFAFMLWQPFANGVQHFSKTQYHPFSVHASLFTTAETNALERAFPDLRARCQMALMSSSPDKVFHVKCPNQELGLRIFGRTAYAKKRGAYRSRLAGEMGLGPEILFVSEDKKVVVWRWLQGEGLTIPMNAADSNQAARMLRQIHAVPKKVRRFPRLVKIEDRVNRRLKELKKVAPDFLDFKRLKQSIKLIEKRLKKTVDHKMIHSDIHQKHVLKTSDGRIQLIDWGDCSTGDPYDDLAAFSYFFCLTPEQDQQFLAAYFERAPTEGEQAHLFLKKLLVGLHYSLWHLRQGLKGKGLMNQTRIGLLPETLQEWLGENGQRSHFSGNPALSKKLGTLGLKDYLKTVATERYGQAIQALK